MNMFFLAFGSIPELEGEWWVVALLGVLAILFIVTIAFMFSAAYGPAKPEQEEEPQEDEEDESPATDFVDESEEEQDEDDDDDGEDDDDDDDDDSDENGDEPIAPVSEAELTTIYNRSFMARLSQSSVEQKDRYNEIKNHILSYKKVKSRISWGFDSFNCGRNRLIKIHYKGKNLMMYLALDPTELDPKYRVKDVSEVRRYQTVPSRIKIKSPRTLKYAKELVDKIMQDNGIVAKQKYEAVDYSVPYMDTETLIENGLIKTKETAAKPFYQQ